MCLFRAVFVLLSVHSLMGNACPGVISREDWDAVVNVHVQYLSRPVNLVIIQHTAWTPCTTDDACEGLMRGIQDYLLDELGYWDIESSFYVGGNGKVYEGVGWLRAGNHTAGYNSNSISINFIGNYNSKNDYTYTSFFERAIQFCVRAITQLDETAIPLVDTKVDTL